MGLTRPRAHQLQDSDFKQSVRAISTSDVTLSGGAPSTVDGVSLSLGDRILVTGQSTASQNGIYVVTTVGAGSNGTWARAVDADTTGDMTAGMVVMVTEGDSYADTSWKITTNDPITLDTTGITFEQSSAYGYGTIAVAGQSSIVADSVGDTLTVASGNNIVVTTDAGSDTLTVAVADNISASGTITATGNITGGNLSISGTINSAGYTDITSAGNITLQSQSQLFFYDSDSSHYLSFRSPTTVSANITWTLPGTDGTDGQVLSTNGGGTLSWADAGAGGGSGGSSYPNSTISTLPGKDGNYDLSKTPAQTTSETPFESGVTDPFGVNLGSVFSMMDPIGSIQTSAEGEGGLDLGVLT